MKLLTRAFLASLLLALSFSVQAVTYQVTFEGTWSSADLQAGAVYPGSAHFSPMIGATHSEGAAFWVNGGLASVGVENVAELGSNFSLRSELSTAKSTGTTGDIIEFNSLFNLPNSDSLEFDVQSDKPFITLITMIAPSPDWFVGVSGLSLLDGDTWVRSLRVELKPYDGGTEEGDQFSLSNPESPSGTVITRLFEPDAPFLGRPTIGTLTFTLKDPPPPPPPPSPRPNPDSALLMAPIINALLQSED